MSTDPSSTKSLFLVYAPDYPDPECLSRRLSVRTTHLANAGNLLEQGILKIGGAMITPETYKTDQKKMTGSTLIYSADSLEEVREIVENDVYYKGNVWDKEKLVITPFVSAKPL
ncbi:hypothetical protein QCA50_004730 [Cerrena zonata]|uniref:YCII-related domain-containing protein n=1 Tax=Cerrena zonata TaxID=2478898 RepID=A0AAW0GPA5_9APHY